jgi:hypothetical protein
MTSCAAGKNILAELAGRQPLAESRHARRMDRSLANDRKHRRLRDLRLPVRIGDEPSRMSGSVISPAVLVMLRATPAIGRFFTSGDDVEGAAPSPF